MRSRATQQPLVTTEPPNCLSFVRPTLLLDWTDVAWSGLINDSALWGRSVAGGRDVRTCKVFSSSRSVLLICSTPAPLGAKFLAPLAIGVSPPSCVPWGRSGGRSEGGVLLSSLLSLLTEALFAPTRSAAWAVVALPGRSFRNTPIVCTADCREQREAGLKKLKREGC